MTDALVSAESLATVVATASRLVCRRTFVAIRLGQMPSRLFEEVAYEVFPVLAPTSRIPMRLHVGARAVSTFGPAVASSASRMSDGALELANGSLPTYVV